MTSTYRYMELWHRKYSWFKQ